jgi:hypothetical protein
LECASRSAQRKRDILPTMRRISLPAVLLLVTLVGTGCQQALFPRDAPRHQFQAHQQMRGEYRPLQEPDLFGNPQPALRARLSRSQ